MLENAKHEYTENIYTHEGNAAPLRYSFSDDTVSFTAVFHGIDFDSVLVETGYGTHIDADEWNGFFNALERSFLFTHQDGNLDYSA